MGLDASESRSKRQTELEIELGRHGCTECFQSLGQRDLVGK